MSKTTIWISRDAVGDESDQLFFWTVRPGVEDGQYIHSEAHQCRTYHHYDVGRDRYLERRLGIPIPAPGELLRVEVSAEVVETIKGD